MTAVRQPVTRHAAAHATADTAAKRWLMLASMLGHLEALGMGLPPSANLGCSRGTKAIGHVGASSAVMLEGIGGRRHGPFDVIGLPDGIDDGGSPPVGRGGETGGAVPEWW